MAASVADISSGHCGGGGCGLLVIGEAHRQSLPQCRKPLRGGGLVVRLMLAVAPCPLLRSLLVKVGEVARQRSRTSASSPRTPKRTCAPANWAHRHTVAPPLRPRRLVTPSNCPSGGEVQHGVAVSVGASSILRTLWTVASLIFTSTGRVGPPSAPQVGEV
jgi:hypothetical protein